MNYPNVNAKLPILLCLLNSYPNFGKAGTASDVFQKVSPSVVLISTEDERGQSLALGSGFVAAKDTVASNLHVVDGAAGATVKVLGQRKTYRVSGVLASSAAKDVALLQVVGLEASPLKLRSGSSISVGETIYAIGNPKGLEGTISSGIVSAHRPVEGGVVLQITAPISPGSSGGPVVDESSMVVGMATATFKGGQALNFAVPGAWLQELLNKGGKSLPLTRTQKTKQQPIIGAFGGPIINAVNLKYTYDFYYVSKQGHGMFSSDPQVETGGTTINCYFANRSDREIKRIMFRVGFVSPEGDPMDFEDGVFSIPIPPKMTRGMEIHYNFNEPGLFHLPGDLTYRDLSHLKGCKTVLCTVADFQYSEE